MDGQPLLLAGAWQLRDTTYEVRAPYDDTLLAHVSRGNAADLEAATVAAVVAFAETRALPAHRRATILRAIATGIAARGEEIAQTLAREAAKPITLARTEVQRSTFLFGYAAEEATRIHGEMLHLDAAPAGEGRQGIVRRFPLGPVAAITPFNFPLNLVAHKLAPAIAAGCPVVLKPASQTPLTAFKLAEIILDAGWPGGALSVLPLTNADAAPLVEDERFKLLTFTGSPLVGWDMKQRAGRKRVALELGGNAGVIVHDDADLAFAATRCVAGGFAYAGQTCISVQRIYVQRQVYQPFLDLFLPKVRALTVGDPLDPATDLSALIRIDEAERVAAWLAEARAAGAEIVGGEIVGGVVQPTVVLGAGAELRVNCQEIFAPVVTVQPYDTFPEALDLVNAGDFGLQAGVFTRDVARIFAAFAALDVGGVIANDVPTWRVDHMPYGGVKHSGFGREGVRYAIEEMTEPRLLVINLG